MTGVGSKLYNKEKQGDRLAIFPMRGLVGGKTSVMSATGLLPAALKGLNIVKTLKRRRTLL